jgi:hypothetical protein
VDAQLTVLAEPFHEALERQRCLPVSGHGVRVGVRSGWVLPRQAAGCLPDPVMAGASYATLAAAGVIIATVILPIARWRSGRDDAAGGSA